MDTPPIFLNTTFVYISNDNGEGIPFYQGKSDYGAMFLNKPTKWTTSITKIAEVNDIVMSVRAPVGPVNIVPIRICIGRGLAAIRPKDKMNYLYLYYMLRETEHNIKAFSNGSTFESVNRTHISQLKIPLPPLEVQQEIVLQLDSYQKIIDGAKQVVDNYKPEIKIDPEWEMVELGKITELINGDRGTNYPSAKYRVATGIPFVNAGHIVDGDVSLDKMDYITPERYDLLGSGKFTRGDILYCLRGSLGKCALVRSIEFGAIASSLLIIRPKGETLARYLYTYLIGPHGQVLISENDTGSAQPNLSANNVRKYAIPLPPLDVQRQIVARIEEEQQLVDTNRKLIQIYKGKIKEKIDEVWGV